MRDCVVVGGGIVGLCTAQALARAGLGVLVLEGAASDRSTSRAGSGILSPLRPWDVPPAMQEWVRHSQALYPMLAAALERETGIRVGWRQTGLLYLGEAERAVPWARAQDVALERLCATDAVQPGLAAGGGPCLWLPETAVIDTPPLLRALRRSLRQAGVALRRGEAVTGLRRGDARTWIADTADGSYRCGHAVVAAGAWSGELLRPLGLTALTRPVRGQLIALRAAAGLLRCVLLRGEHYLVPRGRRIVLAGSTVEDVGYDWRTTQVAGKRLQEAAYALLPPLRNARRLAHWAGLRPASASGLPAIGQVPGHDRLFVNTGHYRNGIVLAPVSARSIVELIVHGREPPAAFRCPDPDRRSSHPPDGRSV